MKLYNTIIVFDVFAVAESEEDAREAVLALICAEEPLPPSEHNVIETRERRNIRTKWMDERPIVGASISDADFEKLKGHTTVEVFEMLHTKNQGKK